MINHRQMDLITGLPGPIRGYLMATHSSVLAWRIPGTVEPSRLQSMGSLRVRHDWVTSLSLFTFMYWRRKWQPTPVFLPWRIPGTDGGAWWAAVYGVAQSRTRLTWLSSSSRCQLWLFWNKKQHAALSLLHSLSHTPNCEANLYDALRFCMWGAQFLR